MCSSDLNDEQMLEVQKLIDSKQKIAPMLGQAEVLVTKLRDVLTFIAQINENDLKKKAQELLIPQLEKVVKDREDVLKALNLELDKKREELKNLTLELEAMSPAKITEEYNEQNQTLILISNAISDVRALSDIEKDIKRDKEEEKGIFVAVKSLEVEASQLESAKNSLKRDYDALQESLQKVSLAGNQAVEELRHSLKSGDDCPEEHHNLFSDYS